MAPKLDSRTARDIAAQVKELLPEYLKDWEPQSDDGGAAQALIGIFARYCEIIIERLNKAPDRNLLAFLNLLGASQAAAQPARVPLTFYLAAQSTSEVIVPALTQAAALPAKGEKEPVVFETEREFALVPARLDSLYVRADATDSYADYAVLLDQAALPPPVRKVGDDEFLEQVTLQLTGVPPSPLRSVEFAADTAADKRARLIDQLSSGGLPIFSGNRRFEHLLFIGFDPISPSPRWKELRLKFVLEKDAPAMPGKLDWTAWDGGSGVQLAPTSDSTDNLTRSGEVVFTEIQPPPVATIHNRLGRWLQLTWSPIDSATNLPSGDSMPIVREVTTTIQSEQVSARMERAALNNASVDISKDFLPFGAKPVFGDTLYLKSALFSAASATVTLQIELTNPVSAGSDVPVPVVRPNAPKLKWEYWDGVEWKELGVTVFGAPATSRLKILPHDAPSSAPKEIGFSDNTQSFAETGEVRFRFSSMPMPTAVGGQTGYWIRVRLISGDYGREAYYELQPEKGYAVTPATFAPPMIHSLRAKQSLVVTGSAYALLAYNNFTYRDVTNESFPLFETGKEARPCCYLGLQPTGGTFSVRSMSLYFGLISTALVDSDTQDPNRKPVSWEYWNGSNWKPRTVQEYTGGFRRSGLVRFLAPRDFSSKMEFGRERYWLRVCKAEADDFNPRLRRVLINTAMATQTQATIGEVLGSGTGNPDQTFHTARKPVLEGQILEVLEPSVPSSDEREKIERDMGPGAITETHGNRAGRAQAWVRWLQTADFEGSGPRDRHYVIDRDEGRITFGDGSAGMMPPALTGNVRMSRYCTGGGSAGNKPAASIVQLKTTIPYVERVTNFEAGSGGADVETLAAVQERAPRELRHRDRAVTREDFEDLAKRASSEVARAKCLPLCDLEADAKGQKRRPGVISLIVAPRWREGAITPQPPDAELFRRVREFLDARRLRSIKLVLAAPHYVRVDVKVEITVDDIDTASGMELAVILALGIFLHPLTGFDGSGWEFGRLPARSELYAALEEVEGVEHVRSLEVAFVSESEDAQTFGHFLVYPGEMQATATLEN